VDFGGFLFPPPFPLFFAKKEKRAGTEEAIELSVRGHWTLLRRFYVVGCEEEGGGGGCGEMVVATDKTVLTCPLQPVKHIFGGRLQLSLPHSSPPPSPHALYFLVL
jgi:hypothetical protein